MISKEMRREIQKARRQMSKGNRKNRSQKQRQQRQEMAEAMIQDGDSYGRAHACERKRRYFNEFEAKVVAIQCMEERGGYIRPYLCPYCGCWHITHETREEFQKNSKQQYNKTHC